MMNKANTAGDLHLQVLSTKAGLIELEQLVLKKKHQFSGHTCSNAHVMTLLHNERISYIYINTLQGSISIYYKDVQPASGCSDGAIVLRLAGALTGWLPGMPLPFSLSSALLADAASRNSMKQ